MAIKDIFKVSRSTFFAPSRWIGLEELRQSARTIGSILSDLFTYNVAARAETFEQAQKRLNKTDAELQEMAKMYRAYALLFLLLGVIAFFFSFYLLFRFISIADWILGMAVTSLFATYAFQYDFWALQLRKRHLGLTFKDWKESILGTQDKKS